MPERQSWVPAGELRPGDRSRSSQGALVTVTAVSRHSGRQDTYDLDVSGIDSYYVRVGTEDVLAHNCTDLARAERMFWDVAHTLDEHVNVTRQQMTDSPAPTAPARWATVSTVSAITVRRRATASP